MYTSTQIMPGQELPPDVRIQIEKIAHDNAGKAGAVIQILQQTQGLIGYLPASALNTVAQLTRIPLSEIYGIVSFYHFFSLAPKGKHVIQVCMGTACYVKGGEKILKNLKKDYGLEPGSITEDGNFSLETVRCLGCCGLSPVIGIGNDIHRKVRVSQIKDILSAYK